MFEEYDIVSLSSPLDRESITIGTRGTILMILDATTGVYEVEFIDSEGEPLGCYTVHKNQITKVS